MLSSVLNDIVKEIRPTKPDEIELVIDVDPAIPAVINTDISKLTNERIGHDIECKGCERLIVR